MAVSRATRENRASVAPRPELEPPMMNVPPKSPRDCAWYLRPFFWNQRRKYGAVLDSALLLIGPH